MSASRQTSEVESVLRHFEVPGADDGRQIHRLARACEALGPVFLELARHCGHRADLLTAPDREILLATGDRLDPLPARMVDRIVRRELSHLAAAELPELDEGPHLAADGMSQLHRATNRDGRDLLLRVMRPQAQEGLGDALEAVQELVPGVAIHGADGREVDLRAAHAGFLSSLRLRLDPQAEIASWNETPPGVTLETPVVAGDLCSRSVLAFDDPGLRLLGTLPPADRPGLRLARAWLRFLLVDGYVWMDPRPESAAVDERGRLVALAGAFTPIGEERRDRLERYLIALAGGHADRCLELLETMLDGGPRHRPRLQSEFRQLVAFRNFGMPTRRVTPHLADILSLQLRAARAGGLEAGDEMIAVTTASSVLDLGTEAAGSSGDALAEALRRHRFLRAARDLRELGSWPGVRSLVAQTVPALVRLAADEPLPERRRRSVRPRSPGPPLAAMCMLFASWVIVDEWRAVPGGDRLLLLCAGVLLAASLWQLRPRSSEPG